MMVYDGCGLWRCDECGYEAWWANIYTLSCPMCNPQTTVSDSMQNNQGLWMKEESDKE